MKLRRILSLAKDEVEQRALSLRMLIMAPLLTLFILGACWGISDPDASLPSSQQPSAWYCSDLTESVAHACQET